MRIHVRLITMRQDTEEHYTHVPSPMHGSGALKGDKKTYQMDPSNINEALIEAQLDMEEGADFIMIKPALHYLDVIRELKTSFSIPTVAYHVSGECAMLYAACANGWLDRKKMVPEK